MLDGRTAPGFGIEEEFLLVDRHTRDVPEHVPPGLIDACREALGGQLADEMFECQLEVTTPILHDLRRARSCLAAQRSRLAKAVEGFGLGLLCAGAHPFADGQATRANPSPRYRLLFDDYRMIARSSLLCGLHVHVGVPRGQDRIKLMNQLLHWLPLLLALSASSPFWLGRPSGSKSYRQAICGQWPRMGVPDAFPSEALFRDHVRWLQGTASIRTENDIWWFIRPSARFPTLELRIADACPRLEDALCIAGLFRAMVVGALGTPHVPAPTARQRQVVSENYWRARHQGIHGSFLDTFGRNGLDAGAWLGRAEETFGPTARALGDDGSFQHARDILSSGSSADRQLCHYEKALERGHSSQQALEGVVDQLLAECMDGTDALRK